MDNESLNKILQIKISQVNKIFDGRHQQLTSYCNKMRMNIINSKLPNHYKTAYINNLKSYFTTQYNNYKQQLNADVLRAQEAHEEAKAQAQAEQAQAEQAQQSRHRQSRHKHKHMHKQSRHKQSRHKQSRHKQAEQRYK